MIKLQNEALSSLLYLSVLDTNRLVLSPIENVTNTDSCYKYCSSLYSFATTHTLIPVVCSCLQTFGNLSMSNSRRLLLIDSRSAMLWR